MIYKDVVYGDIEINEPIILELLSSAPMERLKHITQHGATVYNKHFDKRVVSRFEHSVGVYIFLKNFGCLIEEQIAGLLHDVGHAVFSHVADLLFPHDEHSFDDRSQDNIIRDSEIPKILKKYGISLDYILNKDNFPILEKSLPDLCADRIDYFLRDIKLIEEIDAQQYILDMGQYQDAIVFKTPEIGLDYAKKYLHMDETFWAERFQEFLYAVLAEIIKIAIQKKVLTLKDLHTNEDDVMDILMLSENDEIVDLLEILLNSKPSDILVSNDKKKDYFIVKSKIRIVDPYIVTSKKTDNNIFRVSEIYPEFKKEMDNYRDRMSMPVWLGLKN
ncbi:HD domain-containing protein [bacterium]|nr:HD domain-containing protein [bacterium]